MTDIVEPASASRLPSLPPIDRDRLRAALRAQAPDGGPLMTKLCALSALLRGRRHFAPTTDLALRRWIDGLPIPTRHDPAAPGGWAYGPITDDVVTAWVADLARTFASPE